MKFRFSVEYLGTRYHGFQLQANGSSIQGELERVLFGITRQHCRVHCAGRTDSGVHALGQVAHIELETALDARILEKGCNALLPSDISVSEMQPAALDFHARFSAKARWYRYVIWNHRAPRALYADRCWHIRQKLNVDAMNEAAQFLLGERDFAAFQAALDDAAHARRNVMFARVLQHPAGWVGFHVVANAYVRNMVRIMAGTLLKVGRGDLAPEEVGRILTSCDRTQAGMTAPPHGLTLVKVYYGYEDLAADQARWNSPQVFE